jgi:hypothetical protein
VNKLKMELGSSQNEISALKELSLHAPESSHLDEVLSFLFVNLSVLINCLLKCKGQSESHTVIWYLHSLVVYIRTQKKQNVILPPLNITEMFL